MVYQKCIHLISGRPTSLLTLLLLFCFLVPASVTLARADETVQIGVLAKRGKAISLNRWKATAEYLEQAIPGHAFEVVPLSFDQVPVQVETQQLEFVLVNPAMYVQLENRFRISRMATLKGGFSVKSAETLGSVIFSRSDRLILNEISDIKGMSVAAVDPSSLGGWQIALARLSRGGIDTESDIRHLKFMGTHDLVVNEVLGGHSDIGIIRTDTLEKMASEGKIELEMFSVLPGPATKAHFPFKASTELYPDWAFAKVAHASNDLAGKVAAALYAMQPDSLAAKSADIEGWTVPLNYHAVHDLMKELRLAPYKVVQSESVSQPPLFKRITIMMLIVIFVGVCIMYYRQRKLTYNLSRAKNSLKNYSSRLQLAAHAGELGIWEWNVKKNLFLCDDRTRELFEIASDIDTPTTNDWHNRVHPEDLDKMRTAMNIAISGGEKFDIEYRIINSDNVTRTVRSAAIHRLSRSRNGVIVNGVTWDISDHVKLLEENRKLATQDPLTQARNRRGFFPVARAEFNRCKRYGNRMAVMALDVDDFKQINDNYGHSAGDAVLVSLVKVCQTVLRSSDPFCRMGGEEFAAMLLENSLEQAHAVAVRLKSKISETQVDIGNEKIRFNVSIGIAVLIEADQSFEDTIARADKALYKAKESGKDQIVSDV